VFGALLDVPTAAGFPGLINADMNSDVLGRYVFSVRNGAVQSADLALTMSHSPDPVAPGQNETYTLAVQNLGPSDTTNVIVTDTLPANATLVSATPSQGAACTGTTVLSCNLGSLANAASATLTVTVNVNANATGTVNNSGQVSSDLPDPNPNNNSASATATISTTPTLNSIVVTPVGPSIAVGATIQVTATGHFSDGSTQNLTNTVTWSSSAQNIASINFNGTPGLAKGLLGGQSTITASVTTPMVSGSTTLTVTGPTLTSIAVTPANQTILTGQTLQYAATGTFSDNSTKDLTTQVAWASSDTAVATISNAMGSQGLATAATTLPAGMKSHALAKAAEAPVTQAATTISATLGETQGSTTLTVTSSPVIITVTPPPPGQPSVPTINPGGAAVYGLVLTSQPGFSGTVTLSCTSSAPQFITCAPDPASVTITPGGTTQVAIVLNTFCSRNVPLDMPAPGGPAVLIVVLTGLVLASVRWMYRRRPRWVLTMAAVVIATYSIVGCGSTPSGPAGRTPAGTYTLNLSFKVNGGGAIPGPQLQLVVK
jgi:uncharacterized repeat protein (TIGR01451 family)